MGKYYIGGVATVAAFQNNQHMFTAKTLTDSSIDISVSSEEIRGGDGAQLLGKFFHTSVFNLSITDALFDLKYIAGQVGDAPEGGKSAMVWKPAKNVATSSTDRKVRFKLAADDTMASLDFNGTSSSNYYVWCDQLDGGTFEVTYDDATGYWSFDYDESDILKFGDGTYCISYPVSETGTQVMVNAMYYPGIFSLIMRAKLFEADSCKVSDGQPVGEIVIEIPRFQLDGAINLALSMSSPATYALNGSALANDCSCDSKPWYAKITQVLFNANPYDGYTSIIADEDTLHVGSYAGIYAFAVGRVPAAIPAAYLNSSNQSVINAAGFCNAAGSTTITINGSISPINSSAFADEQITVTVVV